MSRRRDEAALARDVERSLADAMREGRDVTRKLTTAELRQLTVGRLNERAMRDTARALGVDVRELRRAIGGAATPAMIRRIRLGMAAGETGAGALPKSGGEAT